MVDDWEQYVDLMAESIYINSGRGCINCSGVWASRHTKEIAAALAERIGRIEAKTPSDPEAGLAAFTVPGMAAAVWGMIESDLKEAGVTHLTEQHGERLVEQERCAYLRPMIVHCESPDNEIAKKEYMFPFSTVVECPEDQMLARIGPTLVVTALTEDEGLCRRLLASPHVERLNFGPIPTNQISWDQPHEGNLFDFLYQQRALQRLAG